VKLGPSARTSTMIGTSNTIASPETAVGDTSWSRLSCTRNVTPSVDASR